MARGKGNSDADLKTLISLVSGVDEFDENFSICWQFVQSNVKYHKFLGVDSHRLNRSIEGLVTKFQVNSQYEKAACFQELVNQFLETPLSDKKEYIQTDAHYSVIQLLLNLADSPTKYDYEKPVPKKKEDEVDDFDWTAYLLEGENQGRQLYEESSEESDISDDDDDDLANQIVEQKAVCFHSDVIDHSKPHPTLREITTTDQFSVLERGGNWLERNVVVQYWEGVRETTRSSFYQSNLYRDWDCYLSRTDPLHTIPHDSQVTETQLIRELIWMLSGIKELFISCYDDGRFTLLEDLCMSHVTKESLNQTLGIFFECGASIQQIQDFVHRVTCCGFNNNNNDSELRLSDIPQTYQAFAQCLSKFLKSLRITLGEIEKVIIKQEETITLYKLTELLQPWFIKVALVYDVLQRGTKDGCTKGDNTEISSNLLSVLYNAVLDYDGLDEKSTDLVSLALMMWIESSQPYLNVMDQWITNGSLIDPKKEFLVQRNEDNKSLDENYWETAFSLHCPSFTSPEEEVSTDGGRKDSNHSSSEIKSNWAPKFLRPVLKEIVLAGKSMELLQNLGRLGEVIGCKGKQENTKTWYATFIESLSETLGKTAAPSSEKIETREIIKQVSVFTENISEQMMINGTREPLLEVNFAAIFNPSVLRKENLTAETSILENRLSSLDLTGLRPIELLLEHCLYPYAHKRYQLVCSKLVDILIEEYRLLDYLTSMRRFFLMEAGDTLFDFYTQLFSKVQCHEVWRDYYSLNLVLQEALQTHYPEELRRLTLDITQHSYKAKDSNPINVFDGLRLHYKVPWPLDIVISSHTQEIYNQIFIFLLQIKYAKYSLDRLRFSELERENLLKTMMQPEDAFSRYGNEGEEFDLHDDEEEAELPRGQRVHRMELLRMRLINFVNSLHIFIMTRILHSTGLEFMAEIKLATDLDQIIALHTGYVRKIHDRCLQHKAVAFLKEAVTKVLNLCVIFTTRWQQGVDNISSQAIISLETEFGKCIQFLLSFLNNAVKRGSFPHLEPLAFALINSLEQRSSKISRS